jgi:hypothetical protein
MDGLAEQVGHQWRAGRLHAAADSGHEQTRQQATGGIAVRRPTINSGTATERWTGLFFSHQKIGGQFPRYPQG